ncbi:MAG TPA: response regulator [Candidatus Angelobacter sp.]|nr:response regulator [Candidatus Angelobacter sp.]
MIDSKTINVLLVEDDEDDFIITRDFLAEIRGRAFNIEWAKTYEQGLELMVSNRFDVCLVDYRLGACNGVELLRAAIQGGCGSPVILLTTSGHQEIDVEAMEAGASDYLVKGQLQAEWLERSIRYAIQRKRAAAIAAFEQGRLASFGAKVGLALTRQGSLTEILEKCAHAMVQYLNAELAQIFTFDAKKNSFEPLAGAGDIFEQERNAHCLPRMQLNAEEVAQGKALVVRQLLGDGRMANPEWIHRAGLVAYAAYPLILEDKLLGLMSIFTRNPLSHQIAEEMGSVANGIALCMDRKRSEEALGQSESKYRLVVESIKEVIFQLDASGNWTFLNPAWSVITGFDVNESLGKSFLEFVHEKDRDQNRRIFLQLTQRELDYSRHETRCLTEDGKIRWVEFDLQATVNAEGMMTGAFGSISDITDRHLSEIRIQQLAAFPRVNPNPVLEIKADGTLTYANDAARKMARALGQSDLLTIMPAETTEIARDCLATGKKRLDNQVVINGRNISWSFFPVLTNQVVHCYGADVTDALNLEAQLHQAQKMECVGQLAAGVAHDINNVLTIVQGHAGLLLVKVPADSDSAKSLKQICSASERATRFIRQLLMFSRKQVIQTKVLDLNAVIHNLESMLNRMLGEDIALETATGGDLPCVEGDTGMLEQIIMNLVVNARDAMPKGGKLVIATSLVEIDQIYVARHPSSRAGQFVSLTVKDTGCGMDAKTLERIFEPFFTTKEVGKGTGLGLATVYGIVRQHGGWLDVQSQVGIGTTFSIFIPASRERISSNTDFITEAGHVHGGREKILVVEDQVELRELVREVLVAYHYDVSLAASGPEAMQIWEKAGGEFDLLVTDMIMPGGMNGRELAEELKKSKPGLKVVYTSGYSAELIGKDLGRDEAAFLAKPYHPPQLALLVRQCLDAKPQGTATHMPHAVRTAA